MTEGPVAFKKWRVKMLCHWNSIWALKTIALFTCIDWHVSSASCKNAIWWKDKKYNLSDQPRSKHENNPYWTNHAFVFFCFCFISLYHCDLCGLILWWNMPNRQGLQTNHTSIWIVTNVLLEAILFNFHHATSFWTHRCLMLWWKQLLSLSDLLPRS